MVQKKKSLIGTSIYGKVPGKPAAPGIQGRFKSVAAGPAFPAASRPVIQKSSVVKVKKKP